MATAYVFLHLLYGLDHLASERGGQAGSFTVHFAGFVLCCEARDAPAHSSTRIPMVVVRSGGRPK